MNRIIHKFGASCLCLLLFGASVPSAMAQRRAADPPEIIEGPAAIALAGKLGMAVRVKLPNGGDAELQRFVDGFAEYYITHNINAAISLDTNEVWPGGPTGLSLSGSGVTLGIWDGGGVRTTHQEFGGRAGQIDNPSELNSHATHVAGTMVGAGLHSTSHGMANSAWLACYKWDNDDNEMIFAAKHGLLRVSNHSYGTITGWSYGDYQKLGSDDWYWWGNTNVSPVEDYKFGFYGSRAQGWDQIAHDYPRYLIAKSAGNDRSDDHNGGHYVQVWGIGWVWSTDSRDPDGDFDSITIEGVAKNIITVGAVHDVSGGNSNPVMTTFSSWGPADDGRVKPDVVGNGHDLNSCVATGDADYALLSGTSMATPNVSGSIGLLLQHWRQTFPSRQDPLSSTLKGLVIHTADPAGRPGPDYEFGWGLMDTERAALAMTLANIGNAPANNMWEITLLQSEVVELSFWLGSSDDVRATICWTDPPGTPTVLQIDPPDAMLVNDLDIRIIGPSGGTSFPYVLDRNNPSNNAGSGDNIVDNVEQISMQALSSGWHTLQISHKGTLEGGSQDVSVFLNQPNRLEPNWLVVVPRDASTLNDALALVNDGGVIALQPGTYYTGASSVISQHVVLGPSRGSVVIDR